ncbi:MAG: autotransporter outer membrane beta-barrel domain-containing protein, partial [Bosea sp. (in: a-proteobacteria)]
GGTLVGTSGAAFGSGAIRNDARLVLDTASDGVMKNSLSGTGVFEKAGTAKLAYDGDGSQFTGQTVVTAGRLSIGGRLGGSLSLGAGGVLGGNGSVGTVVLGSGATLAPGNSIGTLSVKGDLTLGAGSVYEVEVDPVGVASDRTDVSGKASIQGARLRHLGLSGAYRPGSSYTILTALGGVSGQFAAIESNYAFLTPSLSYQPQSVALQLKRNDIGFADFAATPKARAVARALD